MPFNLLYPPPGIRTYGVPRHGIEPDGIPTRLILTTALAD